MFRDMWFSWAGCPQSLYADPAGEFVSNQWTAFLQSQNVKTFTTTEAWQKRRVERHGQVLKDMLSRMDTDQTIPDGRAVHCAGKPSG